MLRKEINAVFKRKLSGIDIKKDKVLKNYQIPFFFFTFCQNIDRLRGLQCLNA